jgi:hypothetical protein
MRVVCMSCVCCLCNELRRVQDAAFEHKTRCGPGLSVGEGVLVDMAVSPSCKVIRMIISFNHSHSMLPFWVFEG